MVIGVNRAGDLEDSKMNVKQEFKAEATGGWETAEYDQDYTPPPRSSELVAEVSWSWSPAHSRWSKFWLCADQSRSAWHLYEEDHDYDTGKPLYACVAVGMPYKQVLNRMWLRICLKAMASGFRRQEVRHYQMLIWVK